MSSPKATIPKGSWVLVTGATGFVGSHVTQQFLERGYKVRGTVRDLAQASWLVDDVFKAYADRGDLELAHVPDLGAAHAFDEAVRGVSAIAHVASIVSFDPDPNKVVPQTVAGTLSILDAALKEPSVREFVTRVDRDTWNEVAEELAWTPPPYDPDHGPFVYMASKVAAEKEVWKFEAENKPHFTVNVVGPGSIIGQPLHKKHLDGPASWIRIIWDNNVGSLERLPATLMVDVKDVALLHIAAVLDPEAKSQRLQAWGNACNWNDILAILRKLRPEHKFIDDLPNPQHLTLVTDFSEPFALLKKWGSQDGWKTLEQTIADNLDFYYFQ